MSEKKYTLRQYAYLFEKCEHCDGKIIETMCNHDETLQWYKCKNGCVVKKLKQ